MKELEECLEALLAEVKPIEKTEYVALTDACDRILGEDIVAQMMIPPYPKSAMDGYAAPDHPGIWPQILKSFARELLKYAVTDPWDCAFCLQCLQRKEAMPYEAVRAYLHARLGQNKEYTNMQMYGALKRILGEAGGREEIPGQTRKKEGTLLML